MKLCGSQREYGIFNFYSEQASYISTISADDNAPAESDEVLREMPQESPDQTSEETNTEGPGRIENQTRADDAKRDPPVSHSDQIEEHGDTKPDEKPRSKSRLASANDKSNRPAQTFHKSYEPPTEHNDTRYSADNPLKSPDDLSSERTIHRAT